MFNFVTCVENCQVYQLSQRNNIEDTDKNNCLYFGMILASIDDSCISWFVVNTYTTERARDRPFSFFIRSNIFACEMYSVVARYLPFSQPHVKDNHMNWLQMMLSRPKTDTSRLERP